MEEIGLCENGIVVKVVRQPSGLKLLVTENPSHETLATFPTHASFLTGVISGYSYQVASPEGSLTVSSDGSNVSICFDARAKGQRRCRIPRHEFEQAVHDLHDE
jgi:hypothetical protein